MKHIFQTYQKKLTNLSSANRSLFLPRLSALNDMDLHTLDYLENKPSFLLVSDLIAGKSSLTLCKRNDARNEASNKASTRLQAIQRRSEFIKEERGVHDLCIGWPFVQGRFNDGTPVRCPLLLWPVSIQQTQTEWTLLPTNAGMIFNKSFLLAYTHFNAQALDEQLILDFEADYPSDPLAFRTALYELLKHLGLALQFNRDTFVDQLSFFQEYKRADFPLLFQLGELKMMPEAVLGIFPSFGSYLAPDYDFLIDDCEDKSLEDFFLHRTNATSVGVDDNFIAAVKEEQVIAPFAMDIFQENILKSVKKGHSVVVQGPPGTGKSQLIANLTADFIARGKKVLVVCEKRVALEVIYDRFKQIGIHEFVALIHDGAHDRAALYHKMALLIHQFEEHKRNTQNISALRLEQQFTDTSRKIEQITQELDEFRDAWYNPADFGIAPVELHALAKYDQDYVHVASFVKSFDYQSLSSFEQSLQHYIFYRKKLPVSSFWDHRLSFATHSLSHKKQLLELIDGIYSNYHSLIGQIKFNYQPKSALDFVNLSEEFNTIHQLKSLVKDEESYAMMCAIAGLKKELSLLSQLQKKYLLKQGDKELINNSLSGIDEVFVMLDEAINQYQSRFKRLSYQWFNASYKSLKKMLLVNDLSDNLAGLLSLQALIQNALDNRRDLEAIQTMKGLGNMHELDFSNAHLLAFITKLHDLYACKSVLKTSSFTEAILGETLEELNENITTIQLLSVTWKNLYAQYYSYFSKTQIEELISLHETLRATIVHDLDTHFDTFQALDQLVQTFNNQEFDLANLMYQTLPEGNDLNQFLNNSFAIAWKEALALEYPVLKLFESDRFTLLSNTLKQLLVQKTELSKTVLLLRLQENIHKHVEYNRLSNRVTYRDLLHQVSKKKKIWPIRKLVASLSEDIFKLLPCWLASPETVSSVFPMEQYFDVVIFDEASQCFAERGIPAIYRAKQVVITGDSQQLSPNDLYKVRWSEEEEDDTPELAYDSLLDLCGRFFKTMMLKQHYRSNHPDLIAFSNEHFYRNALIFAKKTIPLTQDKPIIFKFIENAVWKNRCNHLEAQEVIHLLKEIQTNHPAKTVGVVTFNYQQQELIYNLIQEGVNSDYLKYDEHLIVKNIENIQGDERDIIIFSVAYAPDEKGKLQMNFGSLSADHGEKRLNVAITRAKDQIYILSSIQPHQLQVEHSLHEGPKLFKKYLELVKNNAISSNASVRAYEWHECLSMKYHVTL
ncbi:MAG: hypothetical protein RL060_226 [Bacteroidota bacterium]